MNISSSVDFTKLSAGGADEAGARKQYSLAIAEQSFTERRDKEAAVARMVENAPHRQDPRGQRLNAHA